MTKTETGKLFSLLEQFYPNAQKSRNARAAWELALEPYRYEDVKAAAVAYVRHGKFFPDLADLTGKLAAEEQEETYASAPWMAKYIAPDYVSRPDTRYAAEHGCTVRRAREALGEEAAE